MATLACGQIILDSISIGPRAGSSLWKLAQACPTLFGRRWQPTLSPAARCISTIPSGRITLAASTAFVLLERRAGADGLLLWKMLFYWNKPSAAGPRQVPSWEIILCRILKWTVVIILGIVTGSIGLLAILPFLPGASVFGESFNTIVIFLALTVCMGWATVRFAREPVAKTKDLSRRRLGDMAVEQFGSLSQWARDRA